MNVRVGRRKNDLLFCLIFVLGCPLTSVGDHVEDGIVFYSTGKWRNTEVEFKTSIRGQKIRMDMKVADTEPVIYLLDVSSQLAYKLLVMKKIAKGPFRQPEFDSIQGDLKKKVPPLYRTGKTETIAGYSATRYVRTYDDGRSFEHWLTFGIQLPPDILRGMSAFTGEFAREDLHALAEQGSFPLRKVGRLSDGSVWMMSEVIKFDRVKLSDEVFEIPPDFNRLEAQNSETAGGIPLQAR